MLLITSSSRDLLVEGQILVDNDEKMEISGQTAGMKILSLFFHSPLCNSLMKRILSVIVFMSEIRNLLVHW